MPSRFSTAAPNRKSTATVFTVLRSTARSPMTKMNKQISACPWCGAHFTHAEKQAAVKAGRLFCPVCRKQIFAFRSRQRMLLVFFLIFVLCAVDFEFLLLEMPLLAVWGFTAVCVTILWKFRSHTIVFSKFNKLYKK